MDAVTNDRVVAPRYHVVVVGARPAKVDGHYLPIPAENLTFIQAVLDQVPAEQYAAIYHGAGVGIDPIIENYCVANRIPQKQFPAYWRDWDFEKREFVDDKYAAAKRTRQMLRAAKDAVYDASTEDNRKVGEFVCLLGFGNPNPEDVTQALIDADLKFAKESAERMKNTPYNYRFLPMPVSMVPTTEAAPTITNTSGQLVTVTQPNPF